MKNLLKQIEQNTQTTDDDVDAFFLGLENEFGKNEMRNWLRHISFIEYFNRVLSLSVPTQFYKNWISTHYYKKLFLYSQKYFPDLIKIRIVVQNQKQSQKANIYYTDSSIIQKTQKIQNNINKEKEDTISIETDELKQFDNFVVGETNKVAHDVIKQLSYSTENTQNNYDLVILNGSPGLGKTHLLQAAANYVQEIMKKNIIFLTAERFVYYYAKYAKEKNLCKFKDFFSDIDMLIVDDIHFLEQKKTCQTELTSIIDLLSTKNKKILFACDFNTTPLDKFDKKLKNRLKGSLVADVKPPSIQIRKQVIQNKLQNLNIQFPNDVIEYISEVFVNDIREIEGAIKKISQYSGTHNKEVTLTDAKYWLNNTNNMPDKCEPENIIQLVAQYTAVNVEDIISKSKVKQFVIARQISMYFIYKYTESSLVTIGKLFSNRSHSTVMHSVDKVKKQIDSKNKIYLDIIKAIEDKL